VLFVRAKKRPVSVIFQDLQLDSLVVSLGGTDVDIGVKMALLIGYLSRGEA
jgi:hypothetical protein